MLFCLGIWRVRDEEIIVKYIDIKSKAKEASQDSKSEVYNDKYTN